MAKTVVFTVIYAVEPGQLLEGVEEPLERLREYGAAEVVDVRVFDGPLEKLKIASMGEEAIAKAVKLDVRKA